MDANNPAAPRTAGTAPPATTPAAPPAVGAAASAAGDNKDAAFSTTASATAAAAAVATAAAGWFGGLWKQSETLMKEVQGGLTEFATVVQHDTLEQAEKVERQLEHLQEKAVPPNQLAGELFSSVTRGLGKLLADDSGDVAKSAASSPARADVHSDRFRAELETLRRTSATFMDDPNAGDEWQEFLASFRISDRTAEISRLLSQHATLRAQHTRLVPAHVPQEAFWQRYFFHVNRLERDEKRRRALFEAGTRLAEEEEEAIGWDEDDEDEMSAVPAVSSSALQQAAVVDEPAPSVTASATDRPAVAAAPQRLSPESDAEDQTTSAPPAVASSATAAPTSVPVVLAETSLGQAPLSAIIHPPENVQVRLPVDMPVMATRAPAPDTTAGGRAPSDDGFELVAASPAAAQLANATLPPTFSDVTSSSDVPRAGSYKDDGISSATLVPPSGVGSAPALAAPAADDVLEEEEDDLLRELDDLPDPLPRAGDGATGSGAAEDWGDWE